MSETTRTWMRWGAFVAGAVAVMLTGARPAVSSEVHNCTTSDCDQRVGEVWRAEDGGWETMLTCKSAGVSHYQANNDGYMVWVNTNYGWDYTAGWWAPYVCNHSYLISKGSAADCYGKCGYGCNFTTGVTNNCILHDFYTRKHGMWGRQAMSVLGPALSDWGAGIIKKGVDAILKGLKSIVSGIVSLGKKILGIFS